MYPAVPSVPSPYHAVPYGVEIANRVFVGGCPYNVRITPPPLAITFSIFMSLAADD